MRRGYLKRSYIFVSSKNVLQVVVFIIIIMNLSINTFGINVLHSFVQSVQPVLSFKAGKDKFSWIRYDITALISMMESTNSWGEKI